MIALSTKNLSVGYGNQALASDLNIDLSKGNLIGLIGQNGVGKSTLLRTLAGFQKPVSGTVLVEGEDIRNLKPSERAKSISVVLTERPNTLNLSVLELLSLARHPYSTWLGLLKNEDIQSIEQALEICQLHHLVEKRLFELSDGQFQKVMIARALTQNTSVIILDEPTSHLDLRNKNEVLNVLRTVADSGKSILLTTHEVSLAAKVCDEFWCMDFDEPLLTGSPEHLMQSGDVQKILHLEDGVL